jgi:hypothetical protein
MLTRKKPETLAAEITLTGQLEELKFNVIFHNRSQAEVEEFIEKNPGDTVALYILKWWDSEYELTKEGLREAEGDRPGILMAMVNAFYQARLVALKGN